VTVSTLKTLLAPTVPYKLCRGALWLTTTGLIPPGSLDLTLVVKPPNRPTVETPIGKHPFITETNTVDLLVDFPWDLVGILSIVLSQEHCGLISPTTTVYRQGGGIPTDGGPLRFLADLYDCDTFIPLENVWPGSNVQAFDANGTQILEQIQAKKLSFPLNVFPCLKQGPVTVVESRCGAEYKITKDVLPIPTPLPSPVVIAPLRPGTRAVRFKGVLTGANVLAFVNGQVQCSPTLNYGTTETVINLWQPLVEKNRVIAI
jgi:hypothetical protein